MVDEIKSTLNKEERRAILSSLELLELEIDTLKGIAQNQMILSNYDLIQWSEQVEKIGKKLLELQQNVIMIASTKIGADIDPKVISKSMQRRLKIVGKDKLRIPKVLPSSPKP